MQQSLFETQDKIDSVLFALSKSGIGVWYHDLNEDYVEFNNEWAEMLGLSPDELHPTSKTWKARIHPSDEPRITAVIGEMHAGRRTRYHEEHRLRHKNGSWIWVLTRGFTWKCDGAGKASVIVGTHVDITYRRRIEEALRISDAKARASEATLRAVMEAVPVGISYSSDTTCTSITGNASVLAQFDAELSDNLSATAPTSKDVGRQVHYFWHGRRVSSQELPLQLAINEGREVGPIELEVHLPSGRIWSCDAYGAPVRNEAGEIIAGVAVTVDVSTRKRAELKERALVEELNHRVRSVLSKVKAIASQIRTRMVDKGHVDQLHARIDALAQSHDLLVSARWEGVDLGTLLREQLKFLGDGALARVSILGEAVILAPHTSQTLGICFHELAANAIRYGALKATGNVSVTWRTSGPDLEIRWDEIGIPPSKHSEPRGYGSTLITEMVAYDLQGRADLHIEDTSLCWQASLPIATNIVESAKNQNAKGRSGGPIT